MVSMRNARDDTGQGLDLDFLAMAGRFIDENPGATDEQILEFWEREAKEAWWAGCQNIASC
jgi:hypothetical protein